MHVFGDKETEEIQDQLEIENIMKLTTPSGNERKNSVSP